MAKGQLRPTKEKRKPKKDKDKAKAPQPPRSFASGQSPMGGSASGAKKG